MKTTAFLITLASLVYGAAVWGAWEGLVWLSSFSQTYAPAQAFWIPFASCLGPAWITYLASMRARYDADMKSWEDKKKREEQEYVQAWNVSLENLMKKYPSLS